MKIAGKRTGPAEIEALLLATGLLAEAAAVAVPDPVKGAALVIACVLKPSQDRSPAVHERLEDAIVQGLGAPFRPSRIVFVPDVPRTRNMKIVRRVIRAVCAGEEPGDLGALANPDAVDDPRAAIRN
ncbi:MAG: hypothetical protein WCZ28_12560 [Burkholderiaceae bacterium]